MASSQRVVFAIRGLECASCAIDIGRALRKVPGIKEINVNYMVNKGYVEFDSDRITWDAVSKALSGRGYTVVKTH
jgi:Cu+-exporting ATPase